MSSLGGDDFPGSNYGTGGPHNVGGGGAIIIILVILFGLALLAQATV
jgi:hypothetical protein